MAAINPKLHPAHRVTFAVATPLATHYRYAHCREVDCPHNLSGWDTVVDVSTDLGAKRADFIRMRSGRAFTYVQTGTIVRFHFPPGQVCFRSHRVPLDKPAIFVFREGDHRGNPRGTEARVMRDVDWLDRFANHQLKLADAKERG